MIPDDIPAAVVAAIAASQKAAKPSPSEMSRWKRSAREPELTIEELRAGSADS